MKERIAKLIDLKTIITISMTAALIYGFISGKITNEQFMTIATMIFTFYFAKKSKDSELEAIGKARGGDKLCIK